MKYLKDTLYIALAVALVFGVVTLAFPKIEYDMSIEAIAVPTEDPAPANYIVALEAIANSIEPIPSEAKVMVLTFWEPYCPACLQQLGELNLLAEAHPDVVIIGITKEADPDVVIQGLVDAGITEMYFGIYPGFDGNSVFQEIPHTHVFFRDGTWKLKPDGTWRGPISADALEAYIVKEQRDNHQL